MNVKNKIGMVHSGTIGKEITICIRYGKAYQRAWVKPYDRKSQCQLYRRGIFKEAMEAWKSLSREEKKALNVRARRKKMNGMNLFIKEYSLKFKY
jgi:hypothetical protein